MAESFAEGRDSADLCRLCEFAFQSGFQDEGSSVWGAAAEAADMGHGRTGAFPYDYSW